MLKTSSNLTSFWGTHFMLPTPFTEDYEIDFHSLEKLLEVSISAKCKGVVTLGVMGEANRLLDTERLEIMKFVISKINQRLPVTVGVSSDSNYVLKSRILEAQKLGASSLLICPPRLNKPNNLSILEYYKIAQTYSEIPVVLQDLPSESGVFLDINMIKKLHSEFPIIKMIKLEDPPTPPKISNILNEIPNISIFGGLGGAFFLEELRRGATGTMTGFAYPEVLSSIYDNVTKGNYDMAKKIFNYWIPLIRYENSAGIGLSIRKNILKHRGIIKYDYVRKPTPEIDTNTKNELSYILDSLNILENSENFSL
ncbi:MAG: hypothetical protein CL778_04190 [Chloroflexi bacterium]|nr:hypothetical protein [Chloroflexota bacterium]|tara:strand:+ start:27172 stop:28104 length:933 start_codon:yes stop_codon:yes gene_type:complete